MEREKHEETPPGLVCSEISGFRGGDASLQFFMMR